MLPESRIMRGSLLFIAMLYGVELLDEFIYGLFGATLPTIKSEFTLTYTQVGLLFTLPGLIGVMSDPFIGLLGDTRHRRALVLGGIVATAVGLSLIAMAQQYLPLLVAMCTMYVASGAYVNLSQATLIDRDPRRAENTMARWVLMGAIGVTAWAVTRPRAPVVEAGEDADSKPAWRNGVARSAPPADRGGRPVPPNRLSSGLDHDTRACERMAEAGPSGLLLPLSSRLVEDELPDHDERVKMLNYLAWAPQAVRNGIVDPNTLPVGQQLIIPGLEGITGILDTQFINFGDSYRGLLRQTQVSDILFRRLNRVVSPSEFYVGSNMIVPIQDQAQYNIRLSPSTSESPRGVCSVAEQCMSSELKNNLQ